MKDCERLLKILIFVIFLIFSNLSIGVIMPKLKSHSGAKKRFSLTGTGKIKRKKQGARHILTGKPAGRMRHLKKSGTLNKVDTKMIRTILPYI